LLALRIDFQAQTIFQKCGAVWKMPSILVCDKIAIDEVQNFVLTKRLGLYAPRSSNQHRYEHRRRRSQYDRGILAADYDILGGRTTELRRQNAISPAQITRKHLSAMANWDDSRDHLQGYSVS